MPPSRQILAAFALVSIAAGSAASATGSRSSDTAVGGSAGVVSIRTAAALRDLSTEEAATGRPATIVGTVTFADKGMGILFVQDATTGFYIDPDGIPGPGVTAGDLVRVEGVTGPGRFAPIVRGHISAVLARAAMPRPIAIGVGDIAGAWLDCQYAELTATVRGVRRRHGLGVDLILSRGSDQVTVFVPDEGASGWTDRLIDADVRVPGVVASKFNQQGQRTGAFLAVQQPGAIEVVRPAAERPFELAVRPIRRLMTWNPRTPGSPRIRVQGTVTLQRGRTVYLTDGTASVRADLVEDRTFVAGDRIDVAGLEVPGDDGPQLTLAFARPLGRDPMPAAAPISVADALSGQYEGALVRVTGTVIGRVPGERETIVLQARGQVFRASFDETFPAESPEDGSLVTVTGVCRVSKILDDGVKVPQGFDILAGPASHLVVQARPSWWTPARQSTATAGLAILMLAAGAWAALLRQQVRRKTSALRERLARQREAEAALRDSESKYRALFELLPEPAWVYDIETLCFLEVNAAAATSYGYSRDEFLALHLADIRPSDEEPTLLTELKAGELQPGGWYRAHGLRHRRKDGVIVEVDVTAHAVTWAGRPARVVLALDTSRQRQIEQDLIRARDAAEGMSRAKGQFLANMSHEIRTPMNGILGMTELALTSLTGEERHYVELAHSSAEALLTVINDILDFSKIEAGRLDLSPVPSDLRPIVEEAVEVLAKTARDHNLRLTWRVAPEVPVRVLLDGGRLRQVLLNLIGNAVKFTESGGVDVAVATENWSGAAGIHPVNVTFSVTDTGIGIPKEQQAAIFDDFVQADGSTSRKYGGTGLGLAIAKRLVVLMGGHIAVKSTPGEGSTFRFSIPVIVCSEEHEERSSGSARPDGFARPVGADAPPEVDPPRRADGLRILVADDNAVNRRLLSALLERQGHTILLAKEGREAVALALRETFDLVLMDLQMPGLDGVTSTGVIREAERSRPDRARLPIVGVTADTVDGVRKRCLEAGMDDVLGKPLSAADLGRVLEWVAGRRAA